MLSFSNFRTDFYDYIPFLCIAQWGNSVTFIGLTKLPRILETLPPPLLRFASFFYSDTKLGKGFGLVFVPEKP